MSEPNSIDPNAREISRRDALRSVALALTAVGTGTMELDAAQHVHEAIRAEKAQGGNYTPKCFNPNEYQTLRRLTEMMIPADAKSASALDAGAPEFIDLLASKNDELARIFTSGMLWLDREMRRHYAATFVDAPEPSQTAMLDQLAEEVRREAEKVIEWPASEYRGFREYTVEDQSTLGPGGRFFEWVRRMTVDAFYTSRVGIDDIEFKGNGFVTEYSVPKKSIDYALARSPFKVE